MNEPMRPQERDAMVAKIDEKLRTATDEEIMKLADALDIEREDPKDDTDESNDAPMDSDSKSSSMVDTSVLTGPRADLKDFLVKKTRDNEAQ